MQEGLVTVVVSISAYYFISNYPATAKFLSDDERAYIYSRLKSDSDATRNEAFTWTNVSKALKDPKCVLYGFAFHTMSLPLYTLSLFLVSDPYPLHPSQTFPFANHSCPCISPPSSKTSVTPRPKRNFSQYPPTPAPPSSPSPLPSSPNALANAPLSSWPPLRSPLSGTSSSSPPPLLGPPTSAQSSPLRASTPPRPSSSHGPPITYPGRRSAQRVTRCRSVLETLAP